MEHSISKPTLVESAIGSGVPNSVNGEREFSIFRWMLLFACTG
jgi:hypothetical protein